MQASQKNDSFSSKYYRNGKHHRSGADVSFADIVKIFGFKTAHVGNWVSKVEQQVAANLFFDALCDLVDILKVPETVISLRGTLSIAFGTGGNKYSCAHYNSTKRQLSLAKNAGGGALAHEWFHAFDHYICSKMYQDAPAYVFASETWLNESLIEIPHPLNDSLSKIFAHMFFKGGIEQGVMSDVLATSIAIDKRNKTFYFARPQEIAARCFESVIQHHPIKNSFLVAGTQQSKEAKLGLYIDREERSHLSTLILSYFSTLGQAIERQVKIV